MKVTTHIISEKKQHEPFATNSSGIYRYQILSFLKNKRTKENLRRSDATLKQQQLTK